MSLRVKLMWAFVGVAFTALLLSFLGLNFGMYAMMGMDGHVGHMVGAEAIGFTLRTSLWASVAALVVAAGVGLWMAGRMTGPLRQLGHAVSLVDLRDLSRRVPVQGADEIADLARDSGTKLFVIEQEAYQGKTPMECMEANFAVMKEWGYL